MPGDVNGVVELQTTSKTEKMAQEGFLIKYDLATTQGCMRQGTSHSGPSCPDGAADRRLGTCGARGVLFDVNGERQISTTAGLWLRLILQIVIGALNCSFREGSRRLPPPPCVRKTGRGQVSCEDEEERSPTQSDHQRAIFSSFLSSC